jgi:acyl dehydratase
LHLGELTRAWSCRRFTRMFSAAPKPAREGRLRRGPVAVRVDPGEVSTFRKALDHEWSDGVPLTFPIRWRGLPMVREILSELTRPDELLLHHSQTFEYRRQIEPGGEYQVEVEGFREESPRSRLVVESSIRDPAGHLVANLQSVLIAARRGWFSAPFEMKAKLQSTGPLLPSLTFGPIEFRNARRYAEVSFDDNPVHLDDAAARAVGLKARVVHGMAIMGLFERAASAWRPGLKIHRLHATFLQPSVLGSQIAFTGRVVQETPQRNCTDLILRLFVYSDSNDLACVGEAAGRIRTSPDWDS